MDLRHLHLNVFRKFEAMLRKYCLGIGHVKGGDVADREAVARVHIRQADRALDDAGQRGHIPYLLERWKEALVRARAAKLPEL